MAAFLAQKGVTAWLPTLVPAEEENYRRAIDAVERLMAAQQEKPVAQALGVHYEGPFVSEKQCGALHEQYFREFNEPGQLLSLPVIEEETAKHIMTMAPEVPGGIELVKELRRRGWIVSIGHTRAGEETLAAAFKSGARHLTHFFNAMSGLHHRDIGVVGFGLTEAGVTCDVIADGIHVRPEILKLLYQIKGAGSLTLISDSILPAGLGDGEFSVWGEKIRVENGRTSNARGSIAGSVISMCDAVRMMLSLGIPEHEVARMAALNPARLLGLNSELGSIEVGKQADLVVLDENHEAVLTVINGRMTPATIN